MQNITSSFAKIAKGDIPGAVKTVENVLKSGLSLSLGFLASAAGLTKIAPSIKMALAKIQKPAKAILTKIKDWIVKMYSSLVKKVTPGSKPAAGAKPVASSDTKAPKTLKAFKTFAAQLGANILRIKAFSDDKTSDDTHDGKVATGVQYLLNAERVALRGLTGDASFTLETVQGVASETKAANKVFKAVNIVPNGLGFSYQLIASETVITAIDPKVVAARLAELNTQPIASLEELKKIEPGVDERYVKDFVLKTKAGEIKQEFRRYVSDRASRKLGKSGETDSIAIYNKASGRNVSKNNKTFEITKGKNKGTTIPDFYSAGQVVGDIKDTKEISFTLQLRRVDQIAKAKDVFLEENSQLREVTAESKFDLVVRKNTNVFGPLEAAINESGGKIYRILENKND